MRVAASNIAWEPADDAAVARALLSRGVSFVEVAPTKRWPDLRGVTVAEAREYGAYWAGLGLPVRSTQSLLFGRPELRLFGGATERRTLVEHLCHVVELGAAMGAVAQVFGSPRNRRREQLPASDALVVAAEAFSEVGRRAVDAGTCVCLEANPERYGADFLTTAAEAAALVAMVDSPGVRLHLDTACMALAGDDAVAEVRSGAPLLRHVHLSEPDLGPVGDPRPAHTELAAALREVGYAGLVSVEMRPASGDPVAALARAAGYTVDVFGDAA